MARSAIHNAMCIPADTSRQMYISYLTSDSLVTVINEMQHRLYVEPCEKDKRRRELYLAILDDCVTELRGRQLYLFKDPQEAVEGAG